MMKWSEKWEVVSKCETLEINEKSEKITVTTSYHVEGLNGTELIKQSLPLKNDIIPPVLVQPLSHVQLFAAQWAVARQASLSSTISQDLLKLMSTGEMMDSTVSSSVTPFFSWPQSFPASGSFPMSQLFKSGGQSIGASASASVLPININFL